MAGETLPNNLTQGPGVPSASTRTRQSKDRPAIGDELTGSSIGAASVTALVELAGQGNQQAWRELVLRFGGMIASVGRRYGLSAADIGELQQTTWLRLVENLHRIEQPERVDGWLATTASRQSVALLKRASRHASGADQMLNNPS